MGSIIRGEGYTTDETKVHSSLISIPSDVKVLILVMPGTAFSTSEVNGLKTFASQGGRIFFVGENGGYYSYGLALENAFLASMGALMTNTGSCDAYPWQYGVGNVNSVPHQLTTGIVATGAGSFFMACVSRINLGPNDFALMTTTVLDGSLSPPPLVNGQRSAVVAAIAKIDLTLTPVVSASRRTPNTGAVRAQNLIAPQGTAGWTGSGPPPPPRP